MRCGINLIKWTALLLLPLMYFTCRKREKTEEPTPSTTATTGSTGPTHINKVDTNFSRYFVPRGKNCWWVYEDPNTGVTDSFATKYPVSFNTDGTLRGDTVPEVISYAQEWTVMERISIKVRTALKRADSFALEGGYPVGIFPRVIMSRGKIFKPPYPLSDRHDTIAFLPNMVLFGREFKDVLWTRGGYRNETLCYAPGIGIIRRIDGTHDMQLKRWQFTD